MAINWDVGFSIDFSACSEAEAFICDYCDGVRDCSISFNDPALDVLNSQKMYTWHGKINTP